MAVCAVGTLETVVVVDVVVVVGAHAPSNTVEISAKDETTFANLFMIFSPDCQDDLSIALSRAEIVEIV